MGWVAYKILVTSPEAKFLFSFLGPFWGLGFGLGLGLRLVNKSSYFRVKLKRTKFEILTEPDLT